MITLVIDHSQTLLISRFAFLSFSYPSPSSHLIKIRGANNEPHPPISHSNSEADLRAAQAYVNQEMSNSGFGTKSAIYTSSSSSQQQSNNNNNNKSSIPQHPRSGTLGLKSNGKPNSSNSNLNNHSSDDLSPQVSERSTSGSRDGSNSTTSEDDGLKTPGISIPMRDINLNGNSLVGSEGVGKENGNPNSRVEVSQMI